MMKFETPHHAPQIVHCHYEILRAADEFIGFEIEAQDILPTEPTFWVEHNKGVLEHGPTRIIILPHLSANLRDRLKEMEFVIIEEKHKRHFSDTLSPWGMDRGGMARSYEAPIRLEKFKTSLFDSFNDRNQV
jgi:hypothetical protein